MGECGVIHGCVLLASYLMCVHIGVCARECTYTHGQARRLEVDTSVFLNHFLFVFFWGGDCVSLNLVLSSLAKQADQEASEFSAPSPQHYARLLSALWWVLVMELTMCLHETQLYQLSHISDGCSLCALDGTRTEEPKSKCHWVLVPIQHNTITGFSGVNSHSAGEWSPKDGCGTHCLPRTSCELDSPQPSPYTLAFRSWTLLQGNPSPYPVT